MLLIEQVHTILGNKYSVPCLEYYLRWLEFFFTDMNFQYNVTYMSITLAAILLPQAFFFGLLLFDVIVSYTPSPPHT